MRWLFHFVVLCAFWAALSLEPAPHLIAVGVVTSAAVAGWALRNELALITWGPRNYLRTLVTYLPWLLLQILSANLRVIRIVWSPTLPIDPRMVEVPCGLETSIGRTIYANSITLTPGTVTVDASESRLLIHALTAEDAEGVASGDMERRVRALEPRG